MSLDDVVEALATTAAARWLIPQICDANGKTLRAWFHEKSLAPPSNELSVSERPCGEFDPYLGCLKPWKVAYRGRWFR